MPLLQLSLFSRTRIIFLRTQYIWPWVFLSFCHFFLLFVIISNSGNHLIDPIQRTLAEGKLNQDEYLSLFRAANALFDSLRSRAGVNQTIKRELKERWNTIGKINGNDVAVQFEASYADQCVANIPDDESLTHYILRKSLNLLSCLKSVVILVLSEGTAFKEYIIFFQKLCPFLILINKIATKHAWM